MTATAKVSDSMSLLWGYTFKTSFPGTASTSHVCRERASTGLVHTISTLAYGRVGVLDYATQPPGGYSTRK